MKLIFVVFLYALLCCVISGQMTTNDLEPLALKIEPVNEKICFGEPLDLKVELRNTSDEDAVIDINGIGYTTSFSVIRIKNNRVTSSNRSGISDSGPYYEGKYALLKPNESYQMIQRISLKDDFFETKGDYRVDIGYGQFLNSIFSKKTVWRGSISSNEATFTLHKCQKLTIKK
ncbi:MAG: hypothetical protein LH614_08130 [Pyrinomonadaceae bacterium]|nr:hypothetical protein [Pyrinomonadaceae bacterium]